MITLKFGGTSMGSAKWIINSADIIMGRAEKDRTSVIVSAVGGISNLLQESITKCITNDKSQYYAAQVKKIHEDICNDIEKEIPGFDAKKVLETIQPIFDEYTSLLKALVFIGECPVSVHCRIMGMGELLISPIMLAVLEAKKQKAALVDSRKVIFTNGLQYEGDPDIEKTVKKLAPYANGEIAGESQILLFPGFICTWKKDQPGLLGRNGSDFSAALIAKGLNSSRMEFWTDVDGIFTADPRIVKDAILVDNMSYEEAMELSFFGSKILHPKTLTPLMSNGIETWSLNSHNPDARGTRIGKGPFESTGPVRGITSLKDVALMTVSGSGLKDKFGSAARIFQAVSRAGVSMLLITQSSSEYSVSFCVKNVYAKKVTKELTSEFEYEIRAGDINPIGVLEDCAIVSIVGDSMIEKRGVAGTFFDSLASVDVNILAIAQGSNERSISAVVEGKSGDIAVRVAHRFFFNTAQSIEVFVFGAGTIGGCLIDQIRDRQAKLAEQQIDINVMAIGTIDGMIMNENGLDLTNWRDDLANSEVTEASLDDILAFVEKTKPLNPVFVDCTAAASLPERYLDVFKAGMHIATPNKKANSMSMEYYHELRNTANAMHKRFLYETNVGAGLPVIDTLQNLIKSGDKLVSFSGIMSGSLSNIFGRLDEGLSFSEAVKEAKELRFTEPDPRDDLGGMDVARKVLIIAREAGLNVEIDDIVMERIYPADFDDTGSIDEYMNNLSKLDDYFADKIAKLKKEGKVLRMAGSIQDGKCKVGVLEVDAENPLYTIRGGENALVFTTERYAPIPLTIRGYGAGAGVTAAGVFGDILRTVSWNPEV